MKDVVFSCKDCTKRRVGCHAYCGRYKLFRAVLKAEKTKEKEFNHDNDRTWRYINPYVRKRFNKEMKSKIT